MSKSVKWVLVLGLGIALSSALAQTGQVWGAPKGKLVVAQAGDPTTLDPHMHAEIPVNVVLHNVYDFLVKRAFKDGKIQHEPMLATSWETVNENTWVLHLRKGVKFHNGEDFNAEAVKFTIERILNPAQKARIRYYYYFVDRVEVVDPYTVKIITKVPVPFFLTNFGFRIAILPPKYTKEKGDAYVATHPVGTGPFKFVRWVKDEEIVLEANDGYWAGAPQIKTLVFKPIPEDSSRVAALLGGDVDIAKNIPIQFIPMINQSNRAKAMTTPGGLTVYIHLDTLKEGPLRDKRVRQALSYGVDKDAIIKTIFEGHGKALGSNINPAHIGYDPRIKPYPYDPEKAKTLLKEAGYGGGINLTFNSPSGRYMKDKEFAEGIAGQLSKIGVNVKVQVHEWGNYMKIIYSPEGAGPMFSFGWAGTFDADSILTPLFHCGEPLSKFCNKQFDSLLEQARKTMDPQKRQNIYNEALTIFHDEAPVLFPHQGVDVYGVSNRVQNWKPTSDESYTLVLYGAAVKD